MVGSLASALDLSTLPPCFSFTVQLPAFFCAALLAGVASAQAPEIIRYTFDAGNADNSASPGVGNGVPNGGVGFGPVGLCTGAGGGGATALSAPLIDTGWLMNLGNSDWTVGMWLDLRTGGNNFQYIWGAPPSGNFRAFLGTGNAVLLGGPSPLGTISIPGSATTAAPHHVVFCYDSAAGEVRGYLNGVLSVTRVLTSPLNLTSTEPFKVMGHITSPMIAGNTIDDFRFYSRCITPAEIDAWANTCEGGGVNVGTTYCSPAVANSTGQPATLRGTGSDVVASNSLGLSVQQLPLNAWGYFLASQTQGTVNQPGGSQGVLCLSGSVGRFVGPGQIKNSGTAGAFALGVDNTVLPTPVGPVAASVGQTWNFQAWYRDAVGGVTTSNFTDGLSVTWR